MFVMKDQRYRLPAPAARKTAEEAVTRVEIMFVDGDAGCNWQNEA